MDTTVTPAREDSGSRSIAQTRCGGLQLVDTIGFEPGVIAAPVKHGDQLHIVERFSLDPEKWVLTREYVAEDPVYFTDQYRGSDQVLVSDVPYVAHRCDELAPEFLQGGASR